MPLVAEGIGDGWVSAACKAWTELAQTLRAKTGEDAAVESERLIKVLAIPWSEKTRRAGPAATEVPSLADTTLHTPPLGSIKHPRPPCLLPLSSLSFAVCSCMHPDAEVSGCLFACPGSFLCLEALPFPYSLLCFDEAAVYEYLMPSIAVAATHGRAAVR